MITKVTFECSPAEAEGLQNLIKLIPELLSALSIKSKETDQTEQPLRREEIIREFKLKESTFFNLQRRGIITPHRLPSSRLTFYYRSEVLSALHKFNPGKYHGR